MRPPPTPWSSRCASSPLPRCQALPAYLPQPLAPEWPAIQLRQDCLKHAFRGLHGAYKRLPHNLGMRSLQIALTVLQMCVSQLLAQVLLCMLCRAEATVSNMSIRP